MNLLIVDFYMFVPKTTNSDDAAVSLFCALAPLAYVKKRAAVARKTVMYCCFIEGKI